MPIWQEPQPDWMRDVELYIDARHQAIQQRLIATFRYVDVYRENRNTFSYEYASLLRDACSVFDTVMKEVVSHTRKSTGITSYRVYLENTERDIFNMSAEVRSRRPQGMVKPFVLWTPAVSPPWWKAHNEVKHSELTGFKSATLEHVVNAVAALKIVKCRIGRNAFEDELWANPTRQWSPGDEGTEPLELLFGL